MFTMVYCLTQLNAMQSSLMLLITPVPFLPAVTGPHVSCEKGLLQDLSHFVYICRELHEYWCQSQRLLRRGADTPSAGEELHLQNIFLSESTL